MMQTLKVHVYALAQSTNTLKLFIELLIPRVEDGNNFGVQVQEDTLSLVSTVEAQTVAMHDQIITYHQSRAKLITKVRLPIEYV
jgi:proteasome activator subunit 3 (PA28 gamma)